jgi:hypothetical protein
MVYSPSERLMIKRGPGSPKRLCHDDAWLYCATLTHENKYDWRMPNRSEHTSIPPSTWFDGRFVAHVTEYHTSITMPVTPVREIYD